jgi:hypothetical protein
VLAWMTVEDVQPYPGFQRSHAARKAAPCSASGCTLTAITSPPKDSAACRACAVSLLIPPTGTITTLYHNRAECLGDVNRLRGTDHGGRMRAAGRTTMTPKITARNTTSGSPATNLQSESIDTRLLPRGWSHRAATISTGLHSCSKKPSSGAPKTQVIRTRPRQRRSNTPAPAPDQQVVPPSTPISSGLVVRVEQAPHIRPDPELHSDFSLIAMAQQQRVLNPDHLEAAKLRPVGHGCVRATQRQTLR